MTKKLRDTPIYLAPQIKGRRDQNYEAIITDETTGQQLNPNCIDDKITIYERQVNGWFLDRASELIIGTNNGFIVLMVAASYIEGAQQYINGVTSNGRSKEFFRQGLTRIFELNDIPETLINKFYRDVRCGLFHNGMSGDLVIISREFLIPIKFTQTPTTIEINPELFLLKIKRDFSDYIQTLRNHNNVTERVKFGQMFNVI